MRILIILYRNVIRGKYAQLAHLPYYGEFWAPTRQNAGALMSATQESVIMMTATFLAHATRTKKTIQNV